MKIIIKLIGIMLIISVLVVSVFSETSFNVQAFPPEDINKNSVTIIGEIINPQNRELNIYVLYKKVNETEFNEVLFVSGIKNEKFNIRYYLDGLQSDTRYEYKFIAQRIGGGNPSITSNIIEFNTNKDLNILQINLDDKFNQYFIITLIIIASLFLLTQFKIITSGILIVVGSLLLFSGFSFIISFLILIFGIGLLFYT